MHRQNGLRTEKGGKRGEGPGKCDSVTFFLQDAGGLYRPRITLSSKPSPMLDPLSGGNVRQSPCQTGPLTLDTNCWDGTQPTKNHPPFSQTPGMSVSFTALGAFPYDGRIDVVQSALPEMHLDIHQQDTTALASRRIK